MTTAISDAGVQFADASVQASAAAPQLIPISASVGSNALTITLNPCALAFRSATLGSGTVTTVNLAAAINLTISSGSTLGTVSAQQSRIVVLAINNAGTIELAAVNISGGNQLDECNLISTTAEGGAGAADSASTIYSTTARTNVAYRVIGYIESTQATAGTWATAPSTIQGAGGNALTSMQSLGYGQTWQNLTGSRNAATTYYNTTGKPIFVAATFNIGAAGTASFTVNGVTTNGSSFNAAGTGATAAYFVVPVNGSYSATSTLFSGLNEWRELR